MMLMSSKYSTQAAEFLDAEAPQESIYFKQKASTRSALKEIILNIFKRKIKAS